MRVAVSILKLEPACGYTQGSPGIDLVDLDGFEPSTPRCKRSIFPIILQAHVWCSVSDSNRPPTHYKCVALPNELTEQVFGLAPPTRTEILYAPNVVTYQLAQCEMNLFNYL